jgi:acyl-CoA thioester hydrolase
MVEVFKQPIVIAPGDIDELGHVNNIVYLRWAQEIAIAHWHARASAEMIANFLWVVTRHEIDYRAPLQLGDEAEVRTWVDDAPRGPLWVRFVEIGKPGEAKPNAQIKSSWCLVDQTTRRIRRVPADLVARFAP